MRGIAIASVVAVLGFGCTSAEHAEPVPANSAAKSGDQKKARPESQRIGEAPVPGETNAVGNRNPEVGEEVLIYAKDPKENDVYAESSDGKDFTSLTVGTRVRYLGPGRQKDVHARVKPLEGNDQEKIWEVNCLYLKPIPGPRK